MLNYLSLKKLHLFLLTSQFPIEMPNKLTPEEQRRSELLLSQIARKLKAYVKLRDDKNTRRYLEQSDALEIMLSTGEFTSRDINLAVESESLYLERFAAISRAYNEVNCLVNAYNRVFPETRLHGKIQGALQNMRNTYTTGLAEILGKLETRTEQLLKEKKRKSN